MDVKQNEKKKTFEERDDPKGKTFVRGIQCFCAGMLFQINFYETFMDIKVFILLFLFSSWLVEGLVMALTTVVLKYIFIFHFSQLSLFVQNRFLVLFFRGGGECIIVKKSDFRTVHICCFEHICIFVMC